MTIFAVRRALETGGLDAGLHYLNHRVAHRFTAIFGLDGPSMRNIAFVDKNEEVMPELMTSIPFEDSFCQFVLRDGQFRASKTGDDSRLDGHKFKGVLQSYTGLPLARSDGQLFGTLCHFDFAERQLHDAEFEFLQQVALMLPEFIQTGG